jgi:hypothetical protein
MTMTNAVEAHVRRPSPTDGPVPPYLAAFDHPEVVGALRAFQEERVDELAQGACFPTNYYDRVLDCATRWLAERGAAKRDVAHLTELYCAFVDTLAPYQPHPAVVREWNKARLPWDPPPPMRGDVFYFLPGSGGYWVKGRAAVEKLARRKAMKAMRPYVVGLVVALAVALAGVIMLATRTEIEI